MSLGTAPPEQNSRPRWVALPHPSLPPAIATVPGGEEDAPTLKLELLKQTWAGRGGGASERPGSLEEERLGWEGGEMRRRRKRGCQQ